MLINSCMLPSDVLRSPSTVCSAGKKMRNHIVHDFEDEDWASQRWHSRLRVTKPVSDEGQAETSASGFPDGRPLLYLTVSTRTETHSQTLIGRQIGKLRSTQPAELGVSIIHHCSQFPTTLFLHKICLFLLCCQYSSQHLMSNNQPNQKVIEFVLVPPYHFVKGIESRDRMMIKDKIPSNKVQCSYIQIYKEIN